MPRHTFKFPQHIREAVQNHVEAAIAGLEAKRYRQEHFYTAALASALQGTAYDGDDGRVAFRATPIDDRGRGAAESIFGPDLALTADITAPGSSISKAILIQAKLGLVDDLNARGLAKLLDQIDKMQATTRSPKVMELPLKDGVRDPHVISGNRLAAGESYRSIPLSKYITSRVLTTLDGDTRSDFVAAVQDSGLIQLHTLATLWEKPLAST